MYGYGYQYGGIKGGGLPFTPPLDVYTGAAAAYSLRLLRSAYAGSAIRVRRSSDSAESDIGFVSNVLDDGTLKAFADNAFIVKLYEQAASLDLSQTTEIGQSIILTSDVLPLVNGKFAIDNTSKLGSKSTSNLNLSSATDVWFFVVLDLPENGTDEVICEHSANYNLNTGAFYVSYKGDTNELNLVQKTGAGSASYCQRIATVTSGQKLLTIRLRSGQTNANYAQLWVNGVSTSTSAGIFTNNSVSFISNTLNFLARNAIIAGLNGKAQELIIYPTDQSANRAAIETNINSYYGIY